jgi:hypothetical protein
MKTLRARGRGLKGHCSASLVQNPPRAKGEIPLTGISWKLERVEQKRVSEQ